MARRPFRRRIVGTLLGATSVAAVAAFVIPLAAPAAATTSPAAGASVRSHRAPATLTVNSPMHYPEGVAWDPTRNAFLVGSAVFGNVSVVTTDGTITPLVTQPGLVTTLGVHVDVSRSRILVAYLDTTPANTVSGLGIFDLRTGETIHLVDLRIGAGPHFANDVTVDPDGNAYVTDSKASVIFKVNMDGEVVQTISDPRFDSGGQIGLNGIVWHPRGFLITGRYDNGQFFRISPKGTVSEVDLNRAVPGSDGLAVTRDGSIITVTNAMGSTTGADTATTIKLTRNGTVGEVTRVVSWPDIAPTAATITPHGTYLLSGRIDRVSVGDLSINSFTLRRLTK